jgi:internalin A
MRKPKLISELEDFYKFKIDKKYYELDEYNDIIKLRLYERKIEDISPLQNFKKLKYLEIRENQISDISVLQHLTNLTFLSLSRNRIIDLTPIRYLTKLESLSLWGNQIVDISPIRNKKRLTQLYLSENNIVNLSPISDLNNFTELDLSKNNIEDISPLQKLSKLTILNISENVIFNIASLEKLINLGKLDLSKNKISNLKPLEELTNLWSLQLSENQIRYIQSLKKLNKLIHLELSSNQIIDISPAKFLNNISRIDFSKNQITDLPLDFVKNITLIYDLVVEGNRSNSNKVYLAGNPLHADLIAVSVSEGRTGILKYLKNKEKSGTTFIREAKLMLLGQPRAGKTTFRRFLLGEDPKDEGEEETTPKIEIVDWHPQNLPEYTFHIWDFGGQEMLYDLHRFFLTQDAFYIIILDAEKNEQPDHYLEYLDTYAPDAPFLILYNKGDSPTSQPISVANQIQDKYSSRLKGIYERVSIIKAAHGNLHWEPIANEIKKIVLESLKDLPHLTKERPKNYTAVKSAIEEIYFNERKPYIDRTTYSDLCEKNNVSRNDEESLLMFLNAIGTVRYLDIKDLRHLHILNPEWITEGAYYIITSDVAKDKRGVLSYNQICKILESCDKKKFHYHTNSIDYVLTVMEKFRISSFDKHKNILYIPLLFGGGQPKPFQSFRQKAYHYYFKFETDVPNFVIAAMIVEFFKDISIDSTVANYWNKGAFLDYGDSQVLIEQGDKRRIDFYFYGRFFQPHFVKLESTLRDILGSLSGLIYKEMIEIKQNNKTIIVTYEVLEARLKHKEAFYYDDILEENINIADVLGIFYTQIIMQNITINGSKAPINIIENDNSVNFNIETMPFWTIWHDMIQQIESSDLRIQLQEIGREIIVAEQADENIKKGLWSKVKESFSSMIKLPKDEATKVLVKKLVEDAYEKIPELAKQVGDIDWSSLVS